MKQLLFLLFLSSTILVNAQQVDGIQEAMANYDYETALSLIEQKEPTIPLLLQKGKALRGLGLNAEALSTYQSVISEDSTNTRALIEAADCSKVLAKFDQALKYYKRTLELTPQNKYVRIQYINLLLSRYKYQEALAESNLLTEKDSSAIALHLQAQSLKGVGELQTAIDCYHHIQEKYPSDHLSAAKLGALYISTSASDDAIAATEKYRQIDSTNLDVNRQNALAYCVKEDYPKAIQRYKYLVHQGDSSFHTFYYLGISYYAVEKHYEARQVLELARGYEPENIKLLYYLGRSCAKTSWKKKGIEYLEKAISLSIPEDDMMTQLYVGMADCYKLAQMPDKQIEAMKERYKKYDKQNHKLLYSIAYIYFHTLKDKKNAELYLEAFLKTRPKDEVEENQELENEDGGLVLEEKNYYNVAANWLKDLKSKQKIEDFFENGKP